METHHRIVTGDARSLKGVSDGSIELVVTSPPYPMIELWDDLFAQLDPDIATFLDRGEGSQAFEAMHAILDDVWEEIGRVLVDGGIACINIGDATRRLDSCFRRYANHARVTRAFEAIGFVPLPTIYWHKPTNASTKFMGSGMIPPNAYVTQEHEHILIFRKGEALRQFPAGAPKRYEAAYFWEERNRWFTDRWSDIAGRRQDLEDGFGRDRAAAFPITIPYRLISMYSVYQDTVLDPFWGTGTTTLAAMAAARNSIGVELDESLREGFDERVEDVPSLSSRICGDRLDRHQRYIEEAVGSGETFSHHASELDVPVKTAQEVDLRLFSVDTVSRKDDAYRVTHESLSGE